MCRRLHGMLQAVADVAPERIYDRNRSEYLQPGGAGYQGYSSNSALAAGTAPPDAAVAAPFPDVAAGAWYETAAAWAKGYGIAAGNDKGQFNPMPL